MARYDNILGTIGDTPLVRLNRIGPESVNIWVKIESFNPMASVKDRMANAIIEAAEAHGEIQPGQTVVEATSGNTGIGLARVALLEGHEMSICLPTTASEERRQLLRAYGADLPSRFSRLAGLLASSPPPRIQTRTTTSPSIPSIGQGRIISTRSRSARRSLR